MNKNIICITLFIVTISCNTYKNECNFIINKKSFSRNHPSSDFIMKQNKKLRRKYSISNHEVDDKENNEWKYLRSLSRTRNFNNTHQPQGGFGD